jgi:hypothetical protein
MKISKIIKLLFWSTEPQLQPEVKQEIKQNNLFQCHYCHNEFEVTSKMVFPVSVPMLYKDSFVQGKGIQCPNCLKNCIYG